MSDNELQFWQVVYAACIHRGDNSIEAHAAASEAVESLRFLMRALDDDECD